MSECSSKLKQVGLALGDPTTYGTASASFTRGLLVSSFQETENQSVEPVGEIRKSLNTLRTTKGPFERNATLNFPLDAGDANSASVGDFLASVIGAETGTIVSGKYKHRFTLLESCLPSYLNLWSDKDVTPKQYKGFRPASVKVTVDAKEGQIPVEVNGIFQSSESLAAQTLAFSNAGLMVPSMVSAITLGGSAVTDIESAEIEITRGQEAINTLGSSRTITKLVSGKNFLTTVTLNGILFANETEKAKFIANTASSFSLRLTDSDSYYLEFNFPSMMYQTFEGPNLSGEDLLRVNLVAIVTGNAWFVDLVNLYTKRYDTGAAIV